MSLFVKEGEAILFTTGFLHAGLRDSLDPIIEEHGGIAMPDPQDSGYSLCDPRTSRGKKLVADQREKHSPDQRWILVCYTFVKACIDAQRILPAESFLTIKPIFENEGSCIPVFLHDSLSPKRSSKLREAVYKWGGEVVDDLEDAEIILAPPHPEDVFKKLIKEARRNNPRAHVEDDGWFWDCIKQGRVEYTRGKQEPVEYTRRVDPAPRLIRGMPGRKPGSRRIEYTQEDDKYLVQYIAKKIPHEASVGRSGNRIYKELVDDPIKYPWGQRHSYQSWLNRYSKNREDFDLAIKKHQNRRSRAIKMGPNSEEDEVTEFSPPKSDAGDGDGDEDGNLTSVDYEEENVQDPRGDSDIEEKLAEIEEEEEEEEEEEDWQVREGDPENQAAWARKVRPVARIAPPDVNTRLPIGKKRSRAESIDVDDLRQSPPIDALLNEEFISSHSPRDEPSSPPKRRKPSTHPEDRAARADYSASGTVTREEDVDAPPGPSKTNDRGKLIKSKGSLVAQSRLRNNKSVSKPKAISPTISEEEDPMPVGSSTPEPPKRKRTNARDTRQHPSPNRQPSRSHSPPRELDPENVAVEIESARSVRTQRERSQSLEIVDEETMDDNLQEEEEEEEEEIPQPQTESQHPAPKLSQEEEEEEEAEEEEGQVLMDLELDGEPAPVTRSKGEKTTQRTPKILVPSSSQDQSPAKPLSKGKGKGKAKAFDKTPPRSTQYDQESETESLQEDNRNIAAFEAREQPRNPSEPGPSNGNFIQPDPSQMPLPPNHHTTRSDDHVADQVKTPALYKAKDTLKQLRELVSTRELKHSAARASTSRTSSELSRAHDHRPNATDDLRLSELRESPARRPAVDDIIPKTAEINIQEGQKKQPKSSRIQNDSQYRPVPEPNTAPSTFVPMVARNLRSRDPPTQKGGVVRGEAYVAIPTTLPPLDDRIQSPEVLPLRPIAPPRPQAKVKAKPRPIPRFKKAEPDSIVDVEPEAPVIVVQNNTARMTRARSRSASVDIQPAPTAPSRARKGKGPAKGKAELERVDEGD